MRLISFYIVFIVNFVNSQSDLSHYATMKDHMISGDAAVTMTARSRVECSTRCSENAGCLATNFLKPNCSLFNSVLSELIVWQLGYAITCKCYYVSY